MPTENPRVTFAITQDMLDVINEYKFDNRLKNQTQAILSLINMGLDVVNGEPVSAPTSFTEKYDTLDAHGKRVVDFILNEEYERCVSGAVAAHGIAPTITLRRYTSPAAAGAPLYAESDYEDVDFPAEIVPDGTSYALGICGKSMEPEIPDGCTVFVEKTEAVCDGDIIVAWIEGDGSVCKRVVMDGDQVVRLESANRDFADITGADLNGMRVYGKVLGYTTE